MVVPLACAAAFFLHAFLFRLFERTLPGLVLWCLVLIAVAMLASAALLSSPGSILSSTNAPSLGFVDRVRLSGVLWDEQQGARLLDICGILWTGLLLYAYLAHRLNGAYGLLGFLFFLTTPLAVWSVGLHFRPLLALYWTTFLLSTLRWNETGRAAWVVLALLAAGAASLLAPQTLLVFALALYFCSLNWIFSSPGLTRLGHPLLLFGLTAAVGLLVLATVQYAAPPGPNGTAGVAARAPALALFFSWLFPRPESPLSGALGMLLLVFLPWSFKGKWTDEKKSLFVFFVAVLLSYVFFDRLGSGWLLLGTAPLVLLAIYGIHNLYLRVKHPWPLYGWILVLVLWNGTRAFSPLILR